MQAPVIGAPVLQRACGFVPVPRPRARALMVFAKTTTVEQPTKERRVNSRPQQSQKGNGTGLSPTASSSYSEETEAGVEALRALYDLQAAGKLSLSSQAQGIKAMLLAAKPKPQGVAASLALLHALGENAFVVDFATKFLESGPAPAQYARDVALALAFSHVALVAPGIDEESASVEATYLHLETALGVLQKHSAAVDLQQQLQASLQGLALAYVEEVLSTPEGPAGFVQNASQRRNKALNALKAALWGVSLSSTERLDALAPLRPYLSAAEQMMLYSAAPKGLQLSEQELYDNALAHLATAVSSGWPHHVLQAHSLLQRVESQNPEVDVSFEQSVCELLLGRRAPQLSPAGAGPPSTSVSSASPQAESGGMLVQEAPDTSEPAAAKDGGYGWAQSWLQFSVLPNFTDTAGKTVNLDKWYSDPKVSMLNKVLYGTNAAWHAADSLAHISSSSRQRIWSLWQTASQQVQHVHADQVATSLLQQSKAALSDVGPRAAAAASAVAGAVTEAPMAMAQVAQRTLRMVPFGLPSWPSSSNGNNGAAGASSQQVDMPDSATVSSRSPTATATPPSGGGNPQDPASVNGVAAAVAAPAAHSNGHSNSNSVSPVSATADADAAGPSGGNSSSMPSTPVDPNSRTSTSPLQYSFDPSRATIDLHRTRNTASMADDDQLLWSTGADGRIRPHARARVVTADGASAVTATRAPRAGIDDIESPLINPVAALVSGVIGVGAAAGIMLLVGSKLGLFRLLAGAAGSSTGATAQGPSNAWPNTYVVVWPNAVDSSSSSSTGAAVPAAPAAAALQRAQATVRGLAAVEELDTTSALALLRTWFELRGQWLGPQHRQGVVGEIADGRLRRAEVKSAAQYRSAGKYVEYSRVAIEVLDVEPPASAQPAGGSSSSGGGATAIKRANGDWVVTAAVHESGTVRMRGSGEVTDAFEQSYRAQYILRRKERGGGWRVVDSSAMPFVLL